MNYQEMHNIEERILSNPDKIREQMRIYGWTDSDITDNKIWNYYDVKNLVAWDEDLYDYVTQWNIEEVLGLIAQSIEPEFDDDDDLNGGDC